MLELKIRKIGNSLGVVLPKAILDKLNADEGDELYMIETPDGFHVSPYDPDFARKMDIAERVMKRYRNTLKELAE